MASPTFLAGGHTPNPKDTQWFIEQRILGALNDGGGGGGGGGSEAHATGSGSPEGVTAAAVGAIYFDTAANSFWYKRTGAGNTGWIQLIA